ncbi:MAG: ATP-binding protein [Pseudomonadota bacterium]
MQLNGALMMQAQPNMSDVKISITSGEFAVREALENLLEALRPLGLDVEEAGTIELVLAEAMNNIVEHAYPPGDIPGQISVACSRKPDGLRFCIVDTGRPMPNGETPIGLPVDLDVDFTDLPEGGFGWFLIKDLAKDVVYRRVDDANQLTFRLALAG